MRIEGIGTKTDRRTMLEIAIHAGTSLSHDSRLGWSPHFVGSHPCHRRRLLPITPPVPTEQTGRSLQNLVDFRGNDEVILAESTDGMRHQIDAHMAITSQMQVGMMLL